MVDLLVVLLVVFAVVLLVSAPLRRRDRAAEEEDAGRPDVAALEAAKAAKYREIRDAELDYRTGKLSQADWEALDGGLRAEAVELLRALDEAGGRRAPVR